MSDHVTRCAACASEFAEDDPILQNANACPACGSRGTPLSSQFDIDIRINWHELRCLVQWAENYVQSCPENSDWTRMWERLKTRLAAYRPEGSAPLTLLEEIQEIRDAGFDVTLYEGKKPE